MIYILFVKQFDTWTYKYVLYLTVLYMYLLICFMCEKKIIYFCNNFIKRVYIVIGRYPLLYVYNPSVFQKVSLSQGSETSPLIWKGFRGTIVGNDPRYPQC